MANTPNIVKAIGNQLGTTLANAINATDTSITVSDGAGFSSSGGYIIIDENVVGKEEIIYIESASGATLTVATDGRGRASTSATNHEVGATISDILVDEHINGIATQYEIEHGDDGTHNTTYVVTPTATQTLTNKTLTSPTVNTPTLVLADSSPTADGSIGYDRTEEELQVGDGTNSLPARLGTWKTWTPTWTNLTVGNSVNTGFYCQIGKTVFFNTRLSLGTTGSVGAAEVSLTLPVTRSDAHTSGFNALCNYTDYGTATYVGVMFHYGTLFVTGGAAAYGTYVSTTSPFTWTTNDAIFINGTYEAA